MRIESHLPRTPVVGHRHDFLADAARGKTVLHVGCTDAGLLEERLQQGTLLHLRLRDVASCVWGIDIDEDGLRELAAAGVDQLIHGDLSDPEVVDALPRVGFELIIVSEVIEHLPNPGRFLEGIRTLAGRTGSELIVTVPNAFSLRAIGSLVKRVERVHPDHNYWFSFRTIHVLLEKHGFRVTRSWMYSFENTRLRPSALRARPIGRFVVSLPWRLFVRLVYRISPFFADGIIVLARTDP